MHRSGTKRSEDTEGRKKDPNLAGMLLSSSVESEPLCEMASEWTAMPQPLVVDSGAAETIIPRLWFPSHKTAESEGSKRVVFYTTPDGSSVENGAKTLIISTADAGQLRKWTFQVANVNKARGSVSMMVRNGNRVVFHTSGSYIENKMTKEIRWLRERNGVYVVDMMVAPPGREEKGTPPFGRRRMQQSLLVQMNQQQNMECGTEEGCTRRMMTRRWMKWKTTT